MLKALSCAFMAVLGFAQPEKVIFDTDCAYFNDDGAALVMLLHRPKHKSDQLLFRRESLGAPLRTEITDFGELNRRSPGKSQRELCRRR